MRLRRIWSEFLPPAELGARATRALLRRFGLQPIVALPPTAECSAMAQALDALHNDGVPIGLWPLLEDALGYWPSASNAENFIRRAHELLGFARRASVRITTLAIDLEPSMELKAHLLRGSIPKRMVKLYAAHRDSQLRDRRRQWTEATRCFSALAAELREERIESLAIAVPPVIFDLPGGSEVWQRLLSAPVVAPGFETVSPMVYSSIVRQALPTRSARLARALVSETSRRAQRTGLRVCMSLGVVGPASNGSAGKLGDERCYDSPEELAIDVGLVRSAGIDDLALFSLEGVLARPHPEQWLSVFAGDGSRPAATRSDRLAGALTRAVGNAASGASKMLSHL